MIRKINVIHHKHKESLQGFTDVQISEISSLVNYSIDMIYCSILNKVEKNKINFYLDSITEKIRYGGQLMLVVTDIRKVCERYVNKSISDEIFFDSIRDVSEDLNEDQMINYLTTKHRLDVIGIVKNNNTTAITFQRKNNDEH